jgi:hypothetical protein
MRLALALGRTVRELEETMSADEWSDWIDFESFYDLPDGYFVAAQLGSIIAGIVGSRFEPSRIVPYLEKDGPSPTMPPASRPGNLAAAFNWLMANVNKDGKPK